MINWVYYQKWRNNKFGDIDTSSTRPAYIHYSQSDRTEVTEPPAMIPVKQAISPTTERKKVQIHTVGRAIQTIDKDGFNVLVDAQGNILTDMKLLAKLRNLRAEIARRDNLPAYCILQNDVLALLATDKPTTREEFIAIKGLRDRKYNKFGEIFMDAIRKHIKEK